ncbi:Glucose-methanol-choline oxidoreductase [Trema orientale]|uniref:Glucose-methanol-choline oxidoreductase n=1 Tax=Trema orientale TaxID=63057 RepID=A0A2P5ERC2_TREOI|nr:Glucose-methanol-choline oxidoreductase [Trema orientale]
MGDLGFLRSFGAFLAGIILFFHGSYCYSEKVPYYTFLKEATSAPAVVHYDYIITGGGTASCPLAATLSQNATVLVLERGGSPYGNPNIANIANFIDLLSDTSATSPAQQFVSEDGVFNQRARVLGGGSAVNAGFYSYASAAYVEKAGWNTTLVDESYEWVGRVVAFEPEVMAWQAAVRDGLLEVGVSPNNGFTYEHLHGTKIGGTIFDRRGHRHTAADLLQYADPRMIVVYLHATVHKILFRYNPGRSRPEAYGVIYKDSNGILHNAYLINNSKNEIIVSAGALGSPQLLMLSGIGPAHHLQAHGIKVVMDQPMVGQGMADNPMNILFIPSPIPVEVSLIQAVGIASFDSFIEAASGLSITRLSKYFEQFLNQTDQYFTRPSETIDVVTNSITIKGGVMLEKVDGPLSSGHLELKNTNPDDNPSVTFNYFKEPEDLKRCVEGMRVVTDVVKSKAFSKFRYQNIPVQSLIDLVVKSPVNLRPRHVGASFSLEQFCIDTVMTIWHYHGGCQVGRVVDNEYKVFGVDALRVIDGSTFHVSPGTNPQATVMMLGRYMGSRILHDRVS